MSKQVKSILIVLISVILIGVAIFGVVVFLNDDGKTIAEDRTENTVNQINTRNQTDSEMTNNQYVENANNTVSGENVVLGNNTSVQNATDTNTTGTTKYNSTNSTSTDINEISGWIEGTTVEQERKVFEDLKLSWTTIVLSAVVNDMGIHKPKLAIEKKAIAVLKDGQMYDIDSENKKIRRVSVGDTIIYKIDVSNPGNYEATNVIVTDSLDVIFDDKLVEAGNEIATIDVIKPGDVATLKVAYVVNEEDIITLENNQNDNYIDMDKEFFPGVMFEEIDQIIHNIAYATDGNTTVEDDDDTPVNVNGRILGSKTWITPEEDASKLVATIELYRDDVKVAEIEVKGNGNYGFENLVKYDIADGHVYEYTVREVSAPGYTSDQDGTDFYNVIEQDYLDVEGTKTWITPEDKSELTATIELYRDGEKIDETIVAGDGAYSFKDLPKYDLGDGHVYTYTVQEFTVEGYNPSEVINQTNGKNFINTIEQDYVEVAGTKTWITPADKSRLTVTIELYRDDEKLTETTVTGDGAYSFTNLDKYDLRDGHVYDYTVQEVPVRGYTPSEVVNQTNGKDFTNTIEQDYLNISGSKKWLAPENTISDLTATIELYRDSQKIDETTVTGNSRYVFNDLPKYDLINGHVYDYTVQEVTVNGYTPSETENQTNGKDFTNTITQAYVDVEGTKTWIAPEDIISTLTVTIELLRDGEKIDTATVTGNGSYKFGGLPKYDLSNGHVYNYTVQEVTVDGYTPSEVVNQTNGKDFTNTIEQAYVDVAGTKTWVTPVDKSTLAVTMKLYRDNEWFANATVTGDGSYSFTHLDKYDLRDGHVYNYTVQEVAVDGYTSSEVTNQTNGKDFTNTIEQEYLDVAGTKTWIAPNNTISTLTVTIELLRDGGKIDERTVTGNGSYKFENLPKYDLSNGHVYNYTVQEATVDGYTPSEVANQTNGKNFTNIIEQAYVDIEGTKTWVTPEDKINLVATIELYQDNEKFRETTVSGNSSYKFEGLPKYNLEDGHTYNYTVKEALLDKYTPSINGYDITNTYNIPTGTVTKKWTSQETTQKEVPIDVVFVLDTSLSMIQYGSTRGSTMVDAVNSAIDQILSFNNQNRVSVVGFSEYGILEELRIPYKNNEEASVLLELGRYTSNKDKKYLVKKGDSLVTTVKEKSGAQTSRYFEAGTYTQVGIKKGAEQLLNNRKANNEKDITAVVDGKTVKRIPIIILLSDGEPTAFNPDYKGLSSQNKCGSAQLKNTTAAYGYYTILTANYYKERVTKHYEMDNNTSAKVFTIAMDISSHYGKTVLNPNTDNVKECKRYTENIDYIANKNISKNLYEYLNLKSDITGKWYRVGEDSLNENSGKTVKIVANPYRTVGYNYADRAFSNAMNAEELKNAMLISITETVPNTRTWTITEEDRAACKVYLPDIDINASGFSIVVGSISYTSCTKAIEDGVVANDTDGYYVDLSVLPAGSTITITYRQN